MHGPAEHRPDDETAPAWLVAQVEEVFAGLPAVRPPVSDSRLARVAPLLVAAVFLLVLLLLPVV
jgi:hypothetical protein